MNMSLKKFSHQIPAELTCREDCIALAKGIIAELQKISTHFDAAISRCEAQEMKQAA